MSGRLSLNHGRRARAGGRFQRALRPFEDRHVVGLAARLEDAGDHRDQEHAADAAMVFGVFGAEIGREPPSEARRAVPMQAVQIVADGVKSPLVGAQIDGLVHGVLADLLQPGGLQEFLQGGDIGVANRPRLEIVCFTTGDPARDGAA